jgi:choline dehydrogenase
MTPGKPENVVDFAERVRLNQRKLRSDLQSDFDFIVCGSGSSGSVVAGRLAENPELDVLLLEAGCTDETELITNPNRWPMTLGTELDWGFVAEPNPQVNGRAIPYSMGKSLGGGSSINVCTWSCGHKADWDFYASEAGDPTGNTMAPCVVIGERAANILRTEYQLRTASTDEAPRKTPAKRDGVLV